MQEMNSDHAGTVRYDTYGTSCLEFLLIDMLPVLVVHGGAGHIPKERSEMSISGVCSAAQAGYAIFQGGGSSMDAVVEAVTWLENNPSFNAGTVM